MNVKANTIEFWVHRDPETEGIATQHWTSHTEPIFDEKHKHYVLSDIGHRLGDKFVHLNVTTKSLLPPDLCPQVKPGMKARVTLEGFYELMDSDNKSMEPVRDILRDHDSRDLVIRQFTDGLIFAKKNEAKLYTRTGVVLTKQLNDVYPVKAEYMDELGELVTRGGEGTIEDYYEIIGYPGDVISPKVIGNLWGNDRESYDRLDLLLVAAYRKGLRFVDTPDDNVVELDAMLMPDGLMKVSCSSPFYGFGRNLLFSPGDKYLGNDTLGTYSIERSIVSAIISYRWFLNKPDLTVSLKGVRCKDADDAECWKTKKEYNSFHRKTDTFVKKTLPSLCADINKRIDERWQKRAERSSHFEPSKLKFQYQEAESVS